MEKLSSWQRQRCSQKFLTADPLAPKLSVIYKKLLFSTISVTNDTNDYPKISPQVSQAYTNEIKVLCYLVSVKKMILASNDINDGR
ncbi:hypothetical protein SK128_028215 [Halocaridina rubra]|uniref:Uncharacterized protein n=1 Tax=Halocaridina rubra TaxID=373956 RepID=A0AAN8ZZM4_HALRR